MTAPMPKDNEVDEKVVAWLITYTERDGSKRQAVYTHNAIADWRMFDPAATSEPLYSAATVAELRARADAAERRVGELERDALRYRKLKRGRGQPFGDTFIIKKFNRTFGEEESVSWSDMERELDADIKQSTLTGADPT